MGEWKDIRVGDLVAEGTLLVSDGYRVRNEELDGEGTPFVRGGDIGDGWIDTDVADHVAPRYRDRILPKLSRPGDVAFITKGSVGRVGRLRPGQPTVVFAPQIAWWRVLDGSRLDPGFVFYLLRGPAFQASLYGVMTHGSMVADYVSISQQLDFVVRVPALPEQRRIAGILGAFDDKIELNRRMSETLEAMAQALFRSWFVDFDPVRAKAGGRDPGLPTYLSDLFPDRLVGSDLGDVPEGWRIAPLSEIASLRRTPIDPASSPREVFRHYSLPAFDQGRRPALDAGADIKSLKTIVPKGSVLLSKLNPEIPRVWLPNIDQDGRSICSTEFLVLEARAPVSATYVYEYLQSAGFRRAMERMVTGTSKSHQRVQASAVLGIAGVVPGAAVAEAFDRITSPLLRRAQIGRRQVIGLERARDALLPALLTGAIEAPDHPVVFE